MASHGNLVAGRLRGAFAGLDKVQLQGVRFRLVDGTNQVVGRLCAEVAHILQGKDKPSYSPTKDTGDVCIVINAAKIVFTGRKWEQKLYRWHTEHHGGLKQISARDLWAKDPTQIILKGVRGMLPINALQRQRLVKLRVFPGSDHPFGELEIVPFEMPFRLLRNKHLEWALPEGFQPMNPEAYKRRLTVVEQRGIQLPRPVVDLDGVLEARERETIASIAATSSDSLEGGNVTKQAVPDDF